MKQIHVTEVMDSSRIMHVAQSLQIKYQRCAQQGLSDCRPSDLNETYLELAVSNLSTLCHHFACYHFASTVPVK